MKLLKIQKVLLQVCMHHATIITTIKTNNLQKNNSIV